MNHSIRYHSRLSHFLVTVEETVNNDVDLELQTPLALIWKSQSIADDAVARLNELSHGVIWELNREGEGLLIREVGTEPGVFIWFHRLVIVGHFDVGHPEGKMASYYWEFIRC